MEIKKSPKADLERKRTWWFLVALGVNISIFVILLECPPSTGETSVNDFTKSVENMVETTEMIPAEEASTAPLEKNLLENSNVNDEIEVVENVDVAEILPPAVTLGKDSIEIKGKEEDEKPLERTDVVTDLKLLEEIPSYPGGMSQFVKWLSKNLKYPEQSKKNRVQGVVLATFIIEKDGSINNLQIKSPLAKDCDEEVLRVLKKMDKWIPGQRNGQICRTLFCIPIEFKL